MEGMICGPATKLCPTAFTWQQWLSEPTKKLRPSTLPNPRPTKLYCAASGHIRNYADTIKCTQNHKWLGIPLIVIFPLATHEPALNNGCGPLL